MGGGEPVGEREKKRPFYVILGRTLSCITKTKSGEGEKGLRGTWEGLNKKLIFFSLSNFPRLIKYASKSIQNRMPSGYSREASARTAESSLFFPQLSKSHAQEGTTTQSPGTVTPFHGWDSRMKVQLFCILMVTNCPLLYGWDRGSMRRKKRLSSRSLSPYQHPETPGHKTGQRNPCQTFTAMHSSVGEVREEIPMSTWNTITSVRQLLSPRGERSRGWPEHPAWTTVYRMSGLPFQYHKDSRKIYVLAEAILYFMKEERRKCLLGTPLVTSSHSLSSMTSSSIASFRMFITHKTQFRVSFLRQRDGKEWA